MTKPIRPGAYNSEAVFFGRLFQIRDVAHLTHLRQLHKSGWEHNALNTLYDEILDKVDTIIESWQGIHGLIDIVIPESRSIEDSIAFTKESYDFIQANRGVFKESWIQNEIDNVCTLLAQTLYRLQFVK